VLASPIHVLFAQRILSQGLQLEEKRTRIRNRNWRRINIAKVFSDRGYDWHGNGAGGTDNDGPEQCRSFASCPSAVLEGSGPEDGRRHIDLCWRQKC
jgi:hypothetical protein